jgi:hypothetical protein
MRGCEPGELLKIVVALMEDQVLPIVETQSGRSTLLLSIGILDNLADRVEERRDIADREQVLADRLIRTVPERLRVLAEAQPAAPTERAAPVSPLIKAFRALVAEPALLDDPATDDWLKLCHQAFRERTQEEVALLSPTRYLRSQNT